MRTRYAMNARAEKPIGPRLRPGRVRIRPGAAGVLSLAATIAAGLFAYGWVTGQKDFYLVSLYAVVPLAGGAVGARRLVDSLKAGPGRYHAVLAVFSASLLCSAISAFIYVADRLRGGAPVEFPSLVDVPNYVSGIFCAAGVWLLYEGTVDDFLEEVLHNSFFLSIIALGTFLVLTAAHRQDFDTVLRSGSGIIGHATQALVPLGYGVNGFLLFRATRGGIGRRFRAGRRALRLLAAGQGLAFAAELSFMAGVTILGYDPGHPLAYRTGSLADVLAATSYLVLSLGILAYPLGAPIFARDDAAPGPATAAPT